MLQKVIARFFPMAWWPAYRKPYHFTTDWFTYRISDWKKYIGFLENKEGLKALEIGTFEGRSALWLLENILTSPTSRLVCVDHFRHHDRGVKERFLKNIKLGQFEDKVEVQIGLSEEVLPRMNETFDLIYIDGNHDGRMVEQDAELCWPKLRSGGVLIFDDYAWKVCHEVTELPQQGIDRFVSKYQHEIKLIYQDYQLIIQKRPIYT